MKKKMSDSCLRYWQFLAVPPMDTKPAERDAARQHIHGCHRCQERLVMRSYALPKDGLTCTQFNEITHKRKPPQKVTQREVMDCSMHIQICRPCRATIPHIDDGYDMPTKEEQLAMLVWLKAGMDKDAA